MSGRPLGAVVLAVLAVLVPGVSAVAVPTAGHPAAAPGDDDRADTDAPAGRFSWPLSPDPTVVRPFDGGTSPYGPGHRGVDLAATVGTPVVAAAAGYVVFAGPVAGRGVVSIDHDGGLRTTYQPLRPSVPTGSRVGRGEVIGTVVAGHDGCAAHACLHWGLRRDGRYLDPLRAVATDVRIRLRPWTG
nr:M23 family metallopeptidase [Saccharomonospora halophila]